MMVICRSITVMLTVTLLAQAAFSQTNCAVEGEIRLSNGTSAFEGIVEVCMGGEWFAVCSGYSWSYSARRNTGVVCNQLGRQLGVPIVDYVSRRSRYFDPISDYSTESEDLSGVSCNGNERRLIDCAHGSTRYCSLSDYVGVSCVPADSSLLPDCSLCRNYYCQMVPFRCENGLCISNSSVCDDRNDCADGSDEETPECIEIRNLRRQEADDRSQKSLELTIGVSIGLVLVVVLTWLAVLGACMLSSKCPVRKLYSHKLAVVPDAELVRTDQESGRAGAERSQELDEEKEE